MNISLEIFNKTKNFSFLTNVLKDGVSIDNNEILAFIDKAETKLKHNKTLFEIEGYADSS